MEDQTHQVFVYGTLKKNEPNHHFMSTATFITAATTCEKFPLVIASKYNIPFLMNKPGVGHNIRGEIYKVNDETLAELDKLENHPTLYVRELLPCQELDSSTVHQAWIYKLKEYKPEMLELEFYESYESKGSHGKVYVASDDDLKDPEEIYEVLQLETQQ